MKKQVLTIVFAALLVALAQAQTIPQTTLGLRLGGNKGFNSEVSAQFEMGALNRLETDLGLRLADRYYGWSLFGTYQWVNDLGGEFQWFWGAGAGMGNWSNYPKYEADNDGGYFLAVAGHIGAEYLPASYPIQIGLDFRPRLGIFNVWESAISLDPALSIRYIF